METPDIATKGNERNYDGLTEMKFLINEFLNGSEGSQKVREYVSSIVEDDSLLLIYLKGRKYRAKHAWETLKRKTQVRFDEYPEIFPEQIEISSELLESQRKGTNGLLKARDKFGRRIYVFNGGGWDPNKISMEQLCAMGTHVMDKVLLDEDAMNNGLIYIQNCGGMGMKHAKEYSLHAMLRLINVFYYAYPIQIKGMFCINVPFYLFYIFKMIKPFLSKKLKERLVVSTSDKSLEALYENISPKLLPKFLGGELENGEALDVKFFETIKNNKITHDLH